MSCEALGRSTARCVFTRRNPSGKKDGSGDFKTLIEEGISDETRSGQGPGPFNGPQAPRCPVAGGGATTKRADASRFVFLFAEVRRTAPPDLTRPVTDAFGLTRARFLPAVRYRIMTEWPMDAQSVLSLFCTSERRRKGLGKNLEIPLNGDGRRRGCPRTLTGTARRG